MVVLRHDQVKQGKIYYLQQVKRTLGTFPQAPKLGNAYSWNSLSKEFSLELAKLTEFQALVDWS